MGVILNDLVTPWKGFIYRHVPEKADVLDFSFAGLSRGRWHDEGQRTLYCTTSIHGALSEWATYCAEWRDENLAKVARGRDVYSIEVRSLRLFDLTQASQWEALGLGDAPECFKAPERCRSISRYIRSNTSAQGLLVPSLRLYDQPKAHNLVVFLEKIDGHEHAFIGEVKQTIGLRLDLPTPQGP